MQMITREMAGRICFVYPRKVNTEKRNSFDTYGTLEGRRQPRERLQSSASRRTNEYKHEEIPAESETFSTHKNDLVATAFQQDQCEQKAKNTLKMQFSIFN